MDETEHHEDAGELAEEAGDISFDGEGFEIDDSQQKLLMHHAEG